MTISNELLDKLLKNCERPKDLLGDGGLMKELKVRLMERMLGAELSAHLGYEAGVEPPPEQMNRRNGMSGKRLKGQEGELSLSVPRDRDGSFEPELIKKGQTRIDGIDDKIIGLYPSASSIDFVAGTFRFALGLSTRDIQAHLEEFYGLKVSPDLISRVTDAVLDEVREWQGRALERMYPIVIFDALRVKIRDADSRMVKNKAVDVALGVTRDGVREVLGIWIAENEGGQGSTCAAGGKPPQGWQEVIPFFAFAPAVRKIIYTTNAVEGLNRVIRKTIKTRGSFPTKDAATKLIYLAIRNFEKGGRNVREWFAARNQFAIMFGTRFNA